VHRLSEHQRLQQVLVCAWAALALAAIYVRGQHLALDRHVSSRLQFHAIPVALSVLYHGRPHDYTAFSSLAISFQASTADARAIASVPPADDKTYYWVADDRGMGDYVIAAFALFGPHPKSLYYAYFVVLACSVVLFLADLGRRAAGNAILLFVLGALYTCVSAWTWCDRQASVLADSLRHVDCHAPCAGRLLRRWIHGCRRFVCGHWIPDLRDDPVAGVAGVGADVALDG
jgi:hypothetical protein